jgi:hypothetical protein
VGRLDLVVSQVFLALPSGGFFLLRPRCPHRACEPKAESPERERIFVLTEHLRHALVRGGGTRPRPARHDRGCHHGGEHVVREAFLLRQVWHAPCETGQYAPSRAAPSRASTCMFHTTGTAGLSRPPSSAYTTPPAALRPVVLQRAYFIRRVLRGYDIATPPPRNVGGAPVGQRRAGGGGGGCWATST